MLPNETNWISLVPCDVSDRQHQVKVAVQVEITQQREPLDGVLGHCQSPREGEFDTLIGAHHKGSECVNAKGEGVGGGGGAVSV